jgi:hypothetical protein
MTVMTRRRTPSLKVSSHRRHAPGEQTPEETAAEDDGLSLPIEPDEGSTLIPDDERVFNIPS